MEGDWKLIYYHEDGHDELYNLAQDIGEQTDLRTQESKRAKKMKNKLNTWLKKTGAEMPSNDPNYDSTKRDARWESIKTSGKEKLEAQHIQFLNPDYKPNKDWWGSSIRD
jgi:hypothetical protein